MTIHHRKLKICGESTWDINDDGSISNIKITVDPRRDGIVRVVIHELIHVYVAMHFNVRMVYEIEEAAVLSWEHVLYDYLHPKNPKPGREKMLDSWAKAIERKTQ